MGSSDELLWDDHYYLVDLFIDGNLYFAKQILINSYIVDSVV